MTPKPAMDSPALTADDFQSLTHVSRETLGRLQIYADLLKSRQRTQNLVSRHTLAVLWDRHMLDSYQLVDLLPPEATSITDVGSGAGFPGLVLAISTSVPVKLVESRARKCAFLREVIEATGATADVANTRIEDLAAESDKKPVDIVTARALAPLPKLCEMAHSLGAITCLFQKGERWQDELTAAKKHWKMVVETFESRTSPGGRILRISGLGRRLNPPG